jgi:hypothetical protein
MDLYTCVVYTLTPHTHTHVHVHIPIYIHMHIIMYNNMHAHHPSILFALQRPGLVRQGTGVVQAKEKNSSMYYILGISCHAGLS